MTLRFGSDAVSESMDMCKPNLVTATRSSIEALERVNLTLPSEDPCVICLEDFSVDQMVIHLPCSHYYHEHCIVQSLEISHLCPLCRYPPNANSGEGSASSSTLLSPRISLNLCNSQLLHGWAALNEVSVST